MLGRRQLREKVMQSIYAYNCQGGTGEERIVEKNMFKGIEQIYDLYIYLLNLLLFQQKIAEHKIELGKNKNFRTKQDLNPNLKFVNNRTFQILNDNIELNNYTQNNKQLQWDLTDTYPNNIYKEIVNSPLYANYMKNETNTFNEDKEFLLAVFQEFIADYEGLHEWFEEKNIYWADDIYIVNTMVYNTIKSFTAKSGSEISLYKVFKDDDDREFAEDLFRRTVRYQSETRKQIEEKAKNWELDRIAAVDLIILEMALTEFQYFPNIPAKVTLNEYIELAKNYSTEKSRVFVNGILDRSLKEFEEKNSMKKYGRGLM